MATIWKNIDLINGSFHGGGFVIAASAFSARSDITFTLFVELLCCSYFQR